MKPVGYLLPLAAILLAGCGRTSARPADKDEIIRAAQNSYYNLPRKGLAEFTCSVIPDWAAALKEETKSDVGPDNPALKLLNGIHFWVSVTETGGVRLTHQIDAQPTSPSQLDDFQKAISGTEEMIDGFWKSAAAFLLTSALPKVGSSYKLSDLDGNYLLSYREGNYDILTTLAKDYSITEIKVTAPTLNSSLKPKFAKTDSGFLLTAYDADYEVTHAEASHVSAEIQYQDVGGLRLPSDLTMRTSTGEKNHEMRVHLADYQVKRR